MMHSCKDPNCQECMYGYVPLQPPEKGTARWMDEIAIDFCLTKKLFAKTAIIKLPDIDGISLGYMAVFCHPGGGVDYARVDNISLVIEK